jgi:hypothetical protein
MDVGLEFAAIWYDADMIELRVIASGVAFRGEAKVYVGIGQLEEAAATLRGFPRSPADGRELTLGPFDPKFVRGAVKMRFYCSDSSGHAYVEAKIESHETSGGTRESALLSIPIEAVALDSFVEELRRLELRKSGIARLAGAPASDRR